MAEAAFFRSSRTSTLADIAALTGAQLVDAARGGTRVSGVAALDRAGPSDLTFFDNIRYSSQLPMTHAAACLISQKNETAVPAHVAVLRTRDPHRAFVTALRHFHPDALSPTSLVELRGVAPNAILDPAARLEDDVTIDPGAVIGPRAEIGLGTVVGANSVIGPDVRIGRNCCIGSGVSIFHALIGNDVIIHAGCRIGQDGFGFLPGAAGHVKIPQIGRVIIQNAVEIGAGTTIDRGAVKDTMIGEGTKIDNLVQIGHNVTIGRHCIIVGQSGLSGSCVLEDGVMLGSRAGIGNHVTVGAGAQIASLSAVTEDVPPGERWGGMPARPAKVWMREMRAIRRLGRDGSSGGNAGQDQEGN